VVDGDRLSRTLTGVPSRITDRRCAGNHTGCMIIPVLNTQTPVRTAGAPATQRFGQFYWVCGRAVLLFVAIDLLLRAVQR
jgi:hypothetical protein